MLSNLTAISLRRWRGAAILFRRAALAFQRRDAWRVCMRKCCLMRTPYRSVAPQLMKRCRLLCPVSQKIPHLFQTCWRNSFDNYNFESQIDSSVNLLIFKVTNRSYRCVLKSGFDWLSELAANRQLEAQVVYGRQNTKEGSKHTYYWGLAPSLPSPEVAHSHSGPSWRRKNQNLKSDSGRLGSSVHVATESKCLPCACGWKMEPFGAPAERGAARPDC